ncbi:AraC family transcriptional regulator [Pseudomonas benzenivorans]|uniref:AraC family transcriptional regulator n=1 Tax=Pseudomonas benzenivorans TaxID=556533 RepID=A0ABZ0PX68_9PSED|nr:AraC family transcriptional regulator [Pseudomonas benzenivorans]WPC05778.1 AraC family transcriptional regulator [Pseudomonas benzenivorans]
MDRLSPLLARFALSAQVFHSGPLCGLSEHFDGDSFGRLHLLRRGRLRVSGPHIRSYQIDQPTLLLFPRPCGHRLEGEGPDGAELLCATFDFGGGLGNPLVRTLPGELLVPLQAIPSLEPVLDLLFDEAFADHCGRQAAIDRLVEYVLILLMRHAMDANLLRVGILAGLAEPRLAKAINAMHEQPQATWTLASLAQRAGMSRARFAVNFREAVGMTPLDYLTEWRLSLAKGLLKQGKPLGLVAPAVGYTSPEALSRAFSRYVGQSPRDWRKELGAP